MRKAVVVGEATAKRNFLCGFSDEGSRNILYSLCKDNAIAEAVHSDEFFSSVEAEKGKIVRLNTPRVPNGIRIVADFSDMPWDNCNDALSADMILFLEEYPFTTKSLIHRLEKIVNHLKKKISGKQLNGIQYRVVFLRDSFQKYGATEMVDIEKALSNASDVIKERLDEVSDDISVKPLVDYVVCKDMNNTTEIFSIKSNTFIILSSVGDVALKNWHSNLKYFKEDYYLYSLEFDFGNRAEEFRRQISGFDENYNAYILHGENRAYKSDIYGIYLKNYKGSCFKKIKEFALNLYDEYISNVCFWDLETDKQRLSEQLDLLCEKVLTFSDRIPFPEKSFEYQELLTKDKCDVKFSEKVGVLETKEIPQTIYEYLQKKEELLLGKKAFGKDKL